MTSDATTNMDAQDESVPATGSAPATESVPATTDTTVTGTTVTGTTGDEAGQAGPRMLPEAELPEPPRPLTPGAFLKLEYEIREVLVRGFTNLYLAAAGDYGATTMHLIAEREVPAESANGADAPVAAAEEVETPADATPEEDATVGILLTDQQEYEDSAGAGAFSNEASVFDAPLPRTVPNAAAAIFDGEPQELPDPAFEATQSVATNEASLPIFAVREEFEQEDREYRVFDFSETTTLQDYRAATGDDGYLKTLHSLACGARWLEKQGLTANFNHDLLRVDKQGQLRYFGFFSPATAELDNVAQLREINDFLLKHVFANSRTMRLDDPYAGLAVSEETRTLARRLSEGEYDDTGTLVNAIEEIYSPTASLKVRSALLSDVGQQRELNEDAGMVFRLQRAGHLSDCDIELYAVADGMGGHEGGEVASDLTLTTLQELLTEAVLSAEAPDWNDNSAVRSFLQDTIDAVNRKVASLAELPKYRGTRARPGSTLVLALRIGARLFVGNVGDSRAYKWNARHGLQRITKDHSYVQTLIDAGSLNEEDAWDHPDGSIITAHIGEPKLRTRDVFLRLAARGDKLLLVSDGVIDMLRDREIAPFLQENDPSAICQGLVDAANAAGGVDNITAICVTFE